MDVSYVLKALCCSALSRIADGNSCHNLFFQFATSAAEDVRGIITVVLLIVFATCLSLSIYYLLKLNRIQSHSETDKQDGSSIVVNALKLVEKNELSLIPKITGLNIMPDRVTQDNYVGVVATYANEGDTDIRFQVQCKVEGNLFSVSTVTLAPHSVKEVTFMVLATEPGDYNVEVGDLHGKFSVFPPQPRMDAQLT